ncbi:ATPase, T2SS/T4P/T4SS family [Modicisalibacter luteus]|uniref:ATPase, T2SS/T4P/T4SS family n=1 Tax=Modicisalibacter luteus TaxID=453962 RepID=A0ABV7LWC6_9GAMM|nr:ATPase, T2SS/T4P/T4SS family [Halomonas lutea]GHB03253.1 hypothetical protein GCM10007159_26310 [Halomonas lutea]
MDKRYTALFVDAAVEDKSPLLAAPTRPYRLLLVDDDPGILAALRRVFQRENYELLFARSAEEALSLLESSPVELVVSDFKMPGMNGSELLRYVRKQWPETLRIMLTGYANTEAVMGSMKEGAVYRFNLKPWDDDDLRLTVALALEQYELRRRNRILAQESPRHAVNLAPLNNLDAGKRNRLAMLLHRKGLLNVRQIQHLHKAMQTDRAPVLSHLLQHDWVDLQAVHALLRDECLCEDVDLREFLIDPSLLAIIPHAICIQQWVLPLRIVGQRLDLAMADPMDTGLIEALGTMTGYDIRPLLCDVGQVQDKLAETLDDAGQHAAGQTMSDGGDDDPYEGIELVFDEEESPEGLEQLLGSSADPPAIRLVNAIILEALRLGASAIHIHPRTHHVAVSYRIDGVLQDKIQIPLALMMSVVSRIKMMAELDITQRRHPQEGRITVKMPMRIVDLDITLLPTVHGEKVAIQILERQAAARSLGDLGLSPHNARRLLHASSQPQGIMIAAGPTDSGKLSMLYALLHHASSAEKHIITLDNPVKYQADLAGQVTANKRSGPDFANLFHTTLQQNPDIILLGELRTEEIATAALEAAASGHLVLSTLRAHSIASVMARLTELKAGPYALASALEAISVQRLARQVCPHCREEVSLSSEQAERLGKRLFDLQSRFYSGRGCRHCHQGYKGRVGLHEVLLMNDALREAVAQGVSPWRFEALAREQGMSTLLDDACEKLRQGLVSPDEILRLLGPQDFKG